MSSGKFSGFTETPAFTKCGALIERKRSMFVVRGPFSVAMNTPLKNTCPQGVVSYEKMNDDPGDNRLSGCPLIEGAEQCRHVS